MMQTITIKSTLCIHSVRHIDFDLLFTVYGSEFLFVCCSLSHQHHHEVSVFQYCVLGTRAISKPSMQITKHPQSPKPLSQLKRYTRMRLVYTTQTIE